MIATPWRNVALFCALALCLCGCGYKFGQGTIPARYTTVSVPYVVGDENGSVTASLVKELDSCGRLQYVCGVGEIILNVNLIDLRDQNIGFRYDRNKKGRLTDWVIPTETRVTAVAEVCVTESRTGKAVLGPVIITASVDFDHDFYTSRDGINTFSLGQLTDIDEARDAVRVPLNKALAKKVVEYINESW